MDERKEGEGFLRITPKNEIHDIHVAEHLTVIQQLACSALVEMQDTKKFAVVSIDVLDEKFDYIASLIAGDEDWESFRQTEQEPVVHGVVYWDFCAQVASAVTPDLEEAFLKQPAPGLVKLIVIDTVGMSVYEITPDPVSSYVVH